MAYRDSFSPLEELERLRLVRNIDDLHWELVVKKHCVDLLNQGHSPAEALEVVLRRLAKVALDDAITLPEPVPKLTRW